MAIAALALGALAAVPAAGAGASGKVVGLLAGAAMLAIVWYTFSNYLAPVAADPDSGLRTALLILAIIAVVKLAMLPWFPGFATDVSSYEAWASQIATLGPARTYQEGYFLDYPPGYLYALWIAGVVANLFDASGTFLRIIVESPALVADFALALLMFAFVRRDGRSRNLAIAAMLLIALNPALLFDTVGWGQSDSVPAFTMLLSVMAILSSQFELCWAVAAISVLVKPQGLMLVPVLALYTLLESDYRIWISSAVSFVAIAIIGIAPFQIGHPWNWIINLYTSTAAYYHETSVNAFNLMALLGGMRQADSDTVAGVSYFALGMSLLVPLYLYVAWILWRGRSARRLMFASFITIFGFFMLAPRMHERYLYPALVFLVPLALESVPMLAVFAILSATCLFNLAYALHILNTVVFMDARDGLAMAASAINLVALTVAVYFGIAALEPGEQRAPAAMSFIERLRIFPAMTAPQSVPIVEEEIAPPAWIRTDTLVLAILIAAALVTRFWHLGYPAEIVFDEVHFVAQARQYLHGEWFLDPHPPLAKLVIAGGIWIFGDRPWSWRVGNAILGTILVGVTYLLGRRLTGSRLAATLAAVFIVCDGLFLVDSRIAVIDIVYLTFAAIAYLQLFRFIQTPDLLERRRILVWLGVALGLCVGSKLYIPVVTVLLVVGFLVYALGWKSPVSKSIEGESWLGLGRLLDVRVAAAVILVGSVALAAFLAVFLPHFILGWWGGMADLAHYYFHDVPDYEAAVAEATHPYSSPWWSWPLMLRPVAYWQSFPKTGPVATVWGGSNPLLLWGALSAIAIMAVQALERPNLSRSFLVLGYLGYLMAWVWIGRTLFLYHYMASLYLGYLALAWLLANCWEGKSELWEHLSLLMTMAPAFILGLGGWWGGAGMIAVFGGYAAMPARRNYTGRYVAVVFVLGALVLFIYYWPVWVGVMIPRSGYYARMWLEGDGLRSWI